MKNEYCINSCSSYGLCFGCNCSQYNPAITKKEMMIAAQRMSAIDKGLARKMRKAAAK